MNDYNGIAWMIGGGLRAESREDQRQRRHRVELAQSAPPRPNPLRGVRVALAAIVSGGTVEPTRASRLAADCCPA